ncbi:hypothetical protein CPC08DRAFT_705021 [Agrocybe pediades]|nr:hypothetical protein CPC08DRAFT_705021 [Agrocybe pediades]
MVSQDLLLIIRGIFNAITPETKIEDSVALLSSVFSPTLIVAALDIIDDNLVVQHVTPWGHVEYGIDGTSYAIFLDMPTGELLPYSCSCITFVSSLLTVPNFIMCKHALAAKIASRMNLCRTSPTDVDALASLITRQLTIVPP